MSNLSLHGYSLHLTTFFKLRKKPESTPPKRSPIVCATTQGIHEGGFSSSTRAHDCSHFFRGKLTSDACTSIYELKWSNEKKDSQRKSSYSTQVMLGHTSVSSECMLCTLKLVSKYQPSRMHFPLDFNFTPTSSKPTYATGRMAEWFSAKLQWSAPA